jgi:hypothetical protein
MTLSKGKRDMQIRRLRIIKPIAYVLAGVFFIASLGSQEAWAVKLLGKTEQISLIFSNKAHHVVLSKRINLEKRGPVAIIYTAECSVAAFDTKTWLNIEILINDVPLPPIGNNVAFCTSTGTNTLDGWVSAATQGRAILDPGKHTIKIVGHLVDFESGDQWSIDDQHLTVIVQKR